MALAENLIADRLYKLKLSKAELATLTGIATQRLIPGLRGVLKLSNVEFERIYSTLDDVVASAVEFRHAHAAESHRRDLRTRFAQTTKSHEITSV
jgi:hypothetical protein